GVGGILKKKKSPAMLKKTPKLPFRPPPLNAEPAMKSMLASYGPQQKNIYAASRHVPRSPSVAIKSSAPLLRPALAANFLPPLLPARAIETWRQSDPELERGSTRSVPPHTRHRTAGWR